MASSFTTNRNFEEPANGDYVNTWNTPVNANFTAIDDCFGGTTTVSLSNSNVTLTTEQLQCFKIVFQGTLSANVVVTVPSGVGGVFRIKNSTTGSFTLGINSGGGGSTLTIPQSTECNIITDGMSMNTPEFATGTTLAFQQPSAPVGWTQNTSISDTALRIVSGNSGGTVNGSVGLSSFITAGALAHTLVTAEIPSHTHGVTDPGHNHAPSTGGVFIVGSQATGFEGININGGTFGLMYGYGETAKAATNISIQNAGGGNSHAHALSDLKYIDSCMCVKN